MLGCILMHAHISCASIVLPGSEIHSSGRWSVDSTSQTFKAVRKTSWQYPASVTATLAPQELAVFPPYCACRVLDGVMFQKDVVLPGRMRRNIPNPRILLLDCPLEYKKGENQTNVELSKEEDW